MLFAKLLDSALDFLPALLPCLRDFLRASLFLNGLLLSDVSGLQILAGVQRDIPVHRIEDRQHDLLLLPLAHRSALCSGLLNQGFGQSPCDLIHAMQRHWWDTPLAPHRLINVLERDLDRFVFVHLWLGQILVPLVFSGLLLLSNRERRCQR